jgi:hypothetical protein
VIAELQEQLLAQERELDSREGAIITWEESLKAHARALGEANTERDASRARADTVWRDCSAQVSAFSSRSRWLNALSQTLEECAALLGL